MASAVPLDEHAGRFVALDEGARAALKGLEPTSLERRQVLTSRTPVAAYVVSGLMRLAFVDRTGRDRTLDFALEGWWLADWLAFFHGRDSVFSLEAVEDCRLVALSPEQYGDLAAQAPLGDYFRAVFQRMAAASQRRVYLNTVSSGEEMYENFARQYPEFLQRVPQYMLASFLGVTPEFLSKIRAKRASRRN